MKIPSTIPGCLFAVAGVATVVGGVGYAAQGPSAGSKIFHSQDCTGCHGPNGEGIAGLAPPLKGSKFVLTATEQQIANVIKNGRSGAQKHFKNLPQPMPPHPDLSAKQLRELVQYLKGGLQKESG